ncbi:MAG: phytanoyl-CoA dioxygenase family protein [Candidatus Hydrogenedentes bacterium]|nr:phytanoyl-CoA dioxygenase family protein [Candidatus Hydrogenedentota bacterium]
MQTKTYTSLGHEIPEHRFGMLTERTNLVNDGASLRAALDADGYLLLRDVLHKDEVLAAREEVFSRLVEVGEILTPAIDGMPTGTSRREEMYPDLGVFWRSVCEGPAIRRVTHAGPMLDIMGRILDGPVRPFDFLWLRAMAPGRASAFHFDHVYMNKGTDRLYTVWTALGDAPLEDGPMLLVEGSHRWDDLIADYRGMDVDKDKSRPGHVTMDPVALADERDCRLLSTNFRAGDILIVTMFMLHGSLDNCSPSGRVRLSCDTRYQRADEPIDPRWIGSPPIGHGGSYGGVGGARPLTAELIRR